MSVPGRLGHAISAGVRAWLFYGLAEYIVWVGRAALGRNGSVIDDSHWKTSLALLLAFATIGAVCGAVLGLVQRANGRVRAEDAAVSVLAFAFLVNSLLVAQRSLAAWLATAAAVFLLAVFAARLSAAWAGRLAFFANPWVAAALMVGAPSSGLTGWEAVAVFLTAAAAGGIVFALWSPARRFLARTEEPAVAWKLLAGMCAVAFAFTVTFSRGLQEAAPGAMNTAASRKLPNVILIVLDTVRADRMSLYGHHRDTTPRLKEWARTASVFTRAVSSSNFTLPSHASLLTGLNVGRHGAHRTKRNPHGQALPPGRRTIAQSLSALGYRTGAILANYAYLNTGFGLDRGFDVYDCGAITAPLRPDRPYFLRFAAARMFRGTALAPDLEREALRAPEINRRALAILKGLRSSGAPFFLFMNYMDAHQRAPTHLFQRFDAGGPSRPLAYRRDLGLELLRRRHRLSREDREYYRADYDNALGYLDSHLGSLLARIRELGLEENSMIIVTSDHGESLGDHDLMGHGITLYQSEIHVPLIIKYPGQAQGAVETIPAGGADIVPTILDVAGQAEDPSLDGRSLRRLQSLPGRAVINEAYGPQPNPHHPSLPENQWAIRSGDWKLIEGDSGSPQLHDLSRDPAETSDLFRQDHPVAAGLRARLRAWRGLVARSRDSSPGGALAPDTLERLKALGYVQ